MCCNDHVSLIFVIICVGGITTLLLYGSISQMIEATHLMASQTTEKCLITDYTASACSDRDDDGTIHYGYIYEFQATSESRCGNKTLFLDEYDMQCLMDSKHIGVEYTCYLVNCHEFSFSPMSEMCVVYTTYPSEMFMNFVGFC